MTFNLAKGPRGISIMEVTRPSPQYLIHIAHHFLERSPRLIPRRYFIDKGVYLFHRFFLWVDLRVTLAFIGSEEAAASVTG